MISNKKYWQNRANERMASYHKNSDETIFKMNKAYNKAISDINADIKNIVDVYKLNGNLSNREVRRLLNTKIPNPIRKTIKRVLPNVKNEKIRRYLISRYNAEAYKARITRLEALKNSINVNTKRLADTELQATTRLYTNNIKEAYYRTMFDIQKGTGIGFDFANMSDRQVQEILKNNWSGEHYSKRIWNNSNVFASKLEETLLNGLMTGHSINKIAKELEQFTDYGKFATERLARTEMTYMCNMAEIECYKEDDIEEYVFLATLDLRTSKQCRKHDGIKYKTSEARSGYNLPPLHAYCRSTTIAYMGKEWHDNLTRRARDPETGKNYVLPKNMNYEEWYQKYVVGKYDEKSKKSSGAIGKIHKNDYERKQNHAKTYYASIRKRNDDVKSISNNTGINKNTIRKIKEHIFINKYDLEEGHTNFYPDYDMSLAWQRLIEGKNIKKSDIVLLNHERLESCLMNKYNYVYEDAHRITCKKYDYSKALREE